MSVAIARQALSDLHRAVTRIEEAVNAFERADTHDDRILATHKLDRAATDVECELAELREVIL